MTSRIRSADRDDSKFREPPLKISGDAERDNHRHGNDDYSQAGDLFCLIPPDSQQRLMHTIAEAMHGVPLEIAKRQVVHFYRADPNYGNGVATRIGLATCRRPPPPNDLAPSPHRAMRRPSPGRASMATANSVREIVVPANEAALNAAIIENQIEPHKVISVILQQGPHLAIGDHEPRYRLLYRL